MDILHHLTNIRNVKGKGGYTTQVNQHKKVEGKGGDTTPFNQDKKCKG